MRIMRIDQKDRAGINAFIVRQWYSTEMVVRGERIGLESADGFSACEGDEIVGLITFRLQEKEREILSLDSVCPNRGIGTALLDKAVAAAKEAGMERVRLITTNDNLAALRFYQKRGFDLAGLYCNAVDRARRIKPEIPLIGNDGIPLRHELELERIL